ncbi:LOW QUALITY PROTEIN: uncharacterized protein LOC108108838 [Drosophila eugracilis]|nr:LOW QUALITY PROTEIN: uncharacterized protein LOC108108838 [Drosophila eugracilis]
MTFGHFMSMTTIVLGFFLFGGGSLNSCHCTSQSTFAARDSWPKS